MKKETQMSVLKEIRDLLKAQQLLGNAIKNTSEQTLLNNLRTVHIPQGLTIEAALAEAKTLFRVWRWTEKNLDEVVISDRSSKQAYSISFKNVVEADEEMKNKSADDLQNVFCITLLERIVMELDYFKETGQHLDLHNWTLCAGSRHAVGRVPVCDWYDGKFDVLWTDTDNRNSLLCARVVVS